MTESQPEPITPVAPTSALLNEATRPHTDYVDDGPITASGLASRQTLVQVHEHLRQELAQIRQVAVQVSEGRMDAASARSVLNRMTIRQNYWSLGAFCSQYCRVVTIHHTIEDRHMFPALRREDTSLVAVLDRLAEEHEIIAEVVEQVDLALVAMMTDESALSEVRRVVDELGEALLSHLAYEETELLGPLGRSSIVV